MQEENYDMTGISKEKIIKEIKELKCYAELSLTSISFKNFLITICSCLKDSIDSIINKGKKFADFLRLFFAKQNQCLREKSCWEGNYLFIIKDDIYK